MSKGDESEKSPADSELPGDNETPEVEVIAGTSRSEEPRGEADGSRSLLESLLLQQQQMFDTMAGLFKRKGLDAADTAEPPAKQQEKDHDISEEEDESDWNVVGDKLDTWAQLDEKEGEAPDVFEDIKDFIAKDEKLGRPLAQSTAELLDAALRTVVPPAKEKEILDKAFPPITVRG